MSTTIYARQIIGVEVKKSDFFIKEETIVNSCGHNQQDPVPKFCPECGKLVKIKKPNTK